MTLSEKEEQIKVKGIRIPLAVLGADPILHEPKAHNLAAGLALITFGTILWTVLGVTCVDKLAKVHRFEQSVCNVLEREAFVRNQTCSCVGIPECTSTYPCILVSVVFKTRNAVIGTTTRGVLYDTIYDCDSECSFAPPCDENQENNAEAVNSFVHSLHNNNVSCYYNPADHQQVILRQNSHVTDLFHAIFWPCLFVLSGLVMFFKYFRSMNKWLKCVRGVP